MSISIISPSRIRAIGPPSMASGDRWPIQGPPEVPENRPSVTRATDLSSPMSTIRYVAMTISRISRETPAIMEMKPSDPLYNMEDFSRAGGLQAVMKSMEQSIDTTVMTASGQSLAENLKEAEIKDSEVIRPINNPREKEGGFAILKGNLGIAVVKQTAVQPEMHRHRGPARVFEQEEELDEFVIWLGEWIKRPVTVRNPIVDASLPDASRLRSLAVAPQARSPPLAMRTARSLHAASAVPS